MDGYSTPPEHHVINITNLIDGIDWSMVSMATFRSIPLKMDATSPVRLSAAHPLLRQWLMHQDQLCQSVAPLQPRKPHLTSAQDAFQRVNFQ